MQPKILGRIAIRFLLGLTPLIAVLVGISGFMGSFGPIRWIWLMPILIGFAMGEFFFFRSIKHPTGVEIPWRARLGKWLLVALIVFLAVSFAVVAILTAHQILQLTPASRGQSWVLLGVTLFCLFSLLISGDVILYALRSEGEEVIKTSLLWGALLTALLLNLLWFSWVDQLLHMLRGK